MLYINDIETIVNDIDIVIDVFDIEKVEKIVNEYNHIEKEKNDIYLTERFFSITIDGIDIDLMVGFKIKSGNEIYYYPSGDSLIKESIIIDNININLCSLQDWQKAYSVMNRESKTELLKKYK